MAGGSGGASKSKSTSLQTAVPLTKGEQQLQGVQLDFANAALRAFQNQGSYQQLQGGLGTAAIGQLGGIQDMLNTLPQEERAGFVRDFFQQSQAAGQRAGEISDIEMQRIRSGGAATPEQIANINAAAQAEMESGLSDINRSALSQMQMVGTELAPRLGLHRSDTPILDRGNRIGAEAVNAAGRLSSDVRGRAAQAQLNYPLAANQVMSGMSQAQQGIGYSRADVLANLNQQAFQNRLALTGQVGQQGLGLATGYNVPAAQQSLRPTLASSSKSSSLGLNMTQPSISSREMKEILSTPDGAEILEKIESLPVAFWRYLAGEDRHDHIGTFAEDFKEAFGLGDGATIHMGDLLGFVLVGLQELAKKVHDIRAEEGS